MTQVQTTICPRERAEAAYITLQEVQHGLQTKAPNSDWRDA